MRSHGMPTIPETLQLALQHHQAGRLPEAEALYRQVLQARPDHPDALYRLGVIAYHAGRHAEAVELMGNAIATGAAVPEFHSDIGEAYRALGDLARAEVHIRRALALKPAYANAHNNLGNVLQAQGRLDEAVACYRQVLALNPASAGAHNNLGNVLKAQGKLNEAVACYRQALELKPDYAEAYSNMGLVLQAQGLLDEAAGCHRQAMALKPDYAEAHSNLGNALKEQGKLDEAVACYRQALKLKPSFSDGYYNLGTALAVQGRAEEAEACYRRALALKPDYAEAHNNLGVLLQEQGRAEDAVECYRQALAIRPGYAEAENQLLHQLQHLCEWSRFEELVARQRRLIRDVPSATSAPYSILCIPSSQAEQLKCARNWVANRLSGAAAMRERMGFRFTRASKPRLRLGYLSADFREHALAYLIAELFELHDRTFFEVCAYSYGPDDKGPTRARVAGACDRFVDIAPASCEQAARRIYEDGIDILIDIQGYTRLARSQIAALRPAPVQVNYLGYPGTMGADFIDYIVTDRFITPPELEPFFSETLAYLPDCYQINDRKRRIADRTPMRKECGLPEDGFVFCCFNSPHKITPVVFDVWMRVLQKVPESVLWLLAPRGGASANLCREAKARGVDPERLVFAPKAPPDHHLARLRLADLFLDTLPYNAHVTASDALWAGLPVLTCAGETFASRVAGSLLKAVGLPELITYSLADYEARAVHLAGNPSELAELRRRLSENRLSAPLFDSVRYTRHLEHAYRMMWDCHCKGEAPRRIEVPA
jgi:predicted O-linked N-acetylglucosamine transferase (SPINDLY family)